MRLTGVVEARDDYYVFEGARAARVLVEDVLGIARGGRS